METVELGSIGNWKGGGTPSKGNKSFWENGTIPWVSPKDMKCKYIEGSIDYITTKASIESSAKLIEKGSVLIVVRSGILRHKLPIALTSLEVTVNQDLKAIELDDSIIPEYLYFFLAANEQEILLECRKKGATVESIDVNKFKKVAVPIPDIAVQRDFVDRLEDRTQVIENLNKSIEKMKQKVTSLNRSMLRAAFRDEL